jgi:hypothetical protein
LRCRARARARVGSAPHGSFAPLRRGGSRKRDCERVPRSRAADARAYVRRTSDRWTFARVGLRARRTKHTRKAAQRRKKKGARELRHFRRVDEERCERGARYLSRPLSLTGVSPTRFFRRARVASALARPGRRPK